MITEDYVSFETAKLLKEKGFPQSTFRCHYIIDGNSHYKNFQDRCGFGDYDIIAPTLAIAMRWLRDTYNIYIYATPWYHEEENPLKKGEYNPVFNGWGYNISNLATNTVIAESDEDNLYSTPEQACEIAIKYYLEKLW